MLYIYKEWVLGGRSISSGNPDNGFELFYLH